MRIAGILEPGTVLGYVVDSKFVKAGLIVVQTIEERDALVNNNSGALVHGTPIYCAGTKKTYRYNEQTKLFSVEPTFIENEDGSLSIVGEDGNPQKIKFNITIDDLDESLKDTIENLPTMSAVEELVSTKLLDYVTLASYTETINSIEEKLGNKQDKLTAGEGIKIENNIISAVYENLEQLKFANKAQFPYQGQEDVLYVAKDEKIIYLWDVVSQDYVSISGTSMPDIEIIDGGDANPVL